MTNRKIFPAIISGVVWLIATMSMITPVNASPLNTWSQVNDSGDPGCTTSCTASPPSIATGYMMPYDSSTNNIILFGGFTTGSTLLNSTWAYNGSTWSQIDDSGDPGCTTSCTGSPPPRYAASIAYQASTNEIILFGGYGSSGAILNDTWAFNGSTWSQVDDSGDPGCTTTCTGSPLARWGATMSSSSTGALILFGGAENLTMLDDTWMFDGSTWVQVDDSGDPGCTTACTGSPPVRYVASMEYNVSTSDNVLFGGETGVGSNIFLNDTWAYNGSTWLQIDDSADPGCTTSCTGSPPARFAAATAYDTAVNELVLFGGYTSSGLINDTWTYNGSAWSQVDDSGDPGCTTACTSSPSARYAASMAYDISIDSVVLFGGVESGGSFLNDTWVLNIPSSTATLTANPNPSISGQNVVLLVTISPSSATGTVDFESDGVSITGCSSQPVITGTATCTTTFNSSGSPYTLIALYSGDSNYNGSASGTLIQRVNPAPAPTPPPIPVPSTGGTGIGSLGYLLLGILFAMSGIKFCVSSRCNNNDASSTNF